MANFCVAQQIDSAKKDTTIYVAKAKKSDYKVLLDGKWTPFVDSVLSVRSSYKHNYLLKDNFGLLEFSNMGHVYNTLTHEVSNDIYPNSGFLAKKRLYYKHTDIVYYDVPTPFLKLTHYEGIRQGTFFNALYTVSPIKQHNISVVYKGTDSQGLYDNNLSQNNMYFVTYRHTSLSQKLDFKMHYIAQDLINEENGGVTSATVNELEDGDADLDNRAQVPVNLSTAKSRLNAKRFFEEGKYGIDILKEKAYPTRLYLTQMYMHETGGYGYAQDTANSTFWGPLSGSATSISDTTSFKNEQTQVGFYLSNPYFKKIGTAYNWRNYENTHVGTFHQNRLRFFTEYEDDNKLIRSHYEKTYLKGKGGHNIGLQFAYKVSEGVKVQLEASINNRQPDYNLQKYQSTVAAYNWDNDFSNIKTGRYGLGISYKKLLDFRIDYTHIKDHVYFSQYQDSLVKPFQYTSTIKYFRSKLSSTILFWKFSLDNDLLYQKVVEGEDVIPLPTLVLRSTIAFKDGYFFRKRLKLQTGLTLNYFTKYYMNGYNALVSEFYTQNAQKIGDVPVLDYFLNLRILNTKIYFKLENINALAIGTNKQVSLYTAPLYPYRDFLIRFGFVWTFFR